MYYEKSESENKKTNKIVSSGKKSKYKVRGIGFCHGM
jgi:hypothetical protein